MLFTGTYPYKKWIHEYVSPYYDAIRASRGNIKNKRDSPSQKQKIKAAELRSTIVELTAKKRVMSEISISINDNSGGGSLGGSTDILSTKTGRQFGGRSEKTDDKKK